MARPPAPAPTVPDPLGILASPSTAPPAGVGVATVPAREVVRRGRGALKFAVLALGGFAGLFAAVKAKQTAAIDLAITLRLQAERSTPLAALMRVASWPGFPPQSRIIPPVVVAALWRLGYRLEAVLQLAAWSNGLLSSVIKRFTRRDRPLSPQVRVVVAPLGGSSFPSGHVLTYVGLYGFLAFLAWSLIKPPPARFAAVGSLAGLVGLVGPSRVYQGHHWFTDVLASYLLGLTTLIGWTSLYEWLKSRQAAKAA
jgi:membrane-associated phospholipid phosphatase